MQNALSVKAPLFMENFIGYSSHFTLSVSIGARDATGYKNCFGKGFFFFFFFFFFFLNLLCVIWFFKFVFIYIFFVSPCREMHEEIIACVGYSLHAFYGGAVADPSRLYIPAIDASPPTPITFVCRNRKLKTGRF